MIDTIRIGISISRTQYRKLVQYIQDTDYWQWVLRNPVTGDVRFVRHVGMQDVAFNSFHREIRWDLPPEFRPGETLFLMEFSIVKYWYGQNIRLLYDFLPALREIKRELEAHLPCRFPDPTQWQLLRFDPCYAWNLGSFQNAKLALESLRKLHFPRKQTYSYPTSIMFKAPTYSLKFYLKNPEFRQHDMKALKRAGAKQVWIEHWERMSLPILRVEATCRRQYLKNQNLLLVGDLLKCREELKLRGSWMMDDSLRTPLIQLIILAHMRERGLELTIEGIGDAIASFPSGYEIPEPRGLFFAGGWREGGDLVLNVQWLDERIVDILQPDPSGQPIPCWHPPDGYPQGRVFRCDGSRSLVIIKKSEAEFQLEKFLTKLMGKNRGMQEATQVQSLLYEKYKSSKAANLLAAWLLIREYGTAKAKEMLGDRNFRRRREELREAGVNLSDPIDVSQGTDAEILKSFEFKVPSLYVVNRYDDGRDEENVLNLEEARFRRFYEAT